MAPFLDKIYVLLGFLAFVQVVFLPGFLLLRFLKVKFETIRYLVFSFGLSLILNYSLVFLLVSLHLYKNYVLYLVFIAEIIVLYGLHSTTLNRFLLSPVYGLVSLATKRFSEKFAALVGRLKPESENETEVFFHYLFLSGALLSIIYVIYIFFNNLGTIFNLNDPILSWNRWALDWSQNVFPRITFRYPQLLPANWSIFYVFIGSALQIFSKSIMPLFFLFILLALFDLGIKKKSYAYFAGTVFAFVLMKIVGGNEVTITEGFAECGLAFFSVLSYYSLVSIDNPDNKKEIGQGLLLGALATAGAVATKQGGFIMIVSFPLLAYFLVLKNSKYFNKKSLLAYFFYYTLVVLLFGLTYHIYDSIAIAKGQDYTAVDILVKGIYGQLDRLHIFFQALISITTKSFLTILLCLFLIPFGLKNRDSKIITLTITLPYFLLWALLVSYDTRNSLLALPFLGLSAGIGLKMLLEKYNLALGNLSQKIPSYSLVILAALFLLGSTVFLSNRLKPEETRLEKKLYDPELNTLLYGYQETFGLSAKILSNYPFLKYLPEIKDYYYIPDSGLYTVSKRNFTVDFLSLCNYLSYSAEPEIGYVLTAPYASQDIRDFLEGEIRNKDQELIFRHEGFTFTRIIRKPNYENKCLDSGL